MGFYILGSTTTCGVGSSVAHCAKDYVESLHQNNRATLLYGKNNVHVQPVMFMKYKQYVAIVQ